ncbi:MAG: 2-oxoacid:acceptor oxidoreductase subunit alpha [Candidatus Marinimicrobia bacterium]|nr:2-oxoacid:acceptor oxidoreductase subunit alpha [Candidatus Neomarinimicrobiota bacterium]
MSETKKGSKKNVETLEQVTIRFAGDSGDGMQLTGHQFTDTTALVGNDLATLPDFPAEIRAPAGSLAGVSSFQIQFSSREIQTPGDHPDVLVAMNPAALKVHLSDLRSNGTIIVNAANFNKRNLQLAGWDSNPLEDGQTLLDYKVIDVDMTRLVGEALSDMGLPPKIIARSTNMFALGLLYWMYSRPMDTTIKFIETKFKSRPEIVEANKRALQAGFNFGYTTEEISTSYVVLKAKKPAGTYRNIMGNQALAMGLVAAANLNGLRLVFSGYPITPASDILHILSGYKHFRVLTFQAEDEIAAVTSAIGAAYAGALAVTATSGPGMALKSEAMGLAISAELPLVAINVQRGGPSTGMPTKTEQSDLFQAMYGRNGESPIVVLAAATPADCFNTAYEACRIAIEHMIPVILLSDGYLGSGSEPWLLPDIDALPPIKNRKVTGSNGEFYPFDFIDQEAMARGWAVPGTPALEHRIGGLEKDSRTGNVSGDYDNHQQMVDRRAQKVAVVARNIPLATIHGDDSSELLVLGWGSTYGAIRAAVDSAREQGYSVSQLHLRHLNPFPSNLGELLLRFPKIIVPEINTGQLTRIIRAEFLVDANVLSKVSGKPFFPSEIEERIIQILGEK